MKLIAAALLFLTLSACGSGTDEILITCTNAGSGKQICGATSGAGVDINSPDAERTPR